MTPTAIVQCVSVGIALIALFVAIWAHVRQHGISARLLALEESREKDRQLLQMSARPRVELILVEEQRVPRPHLRVMNDGENLASDVEVLVDGKPLHEHVISRQKTPHTRPSIPPGGHFDFPVIMEYKTQLSVQVRFSDKVGTHTSEVMSLSPWEH